jgi:hypothetical protein
MAGTPKSQAAANFLKLEAAKLAQRYGQTEGIRLGAEMQAGNYGDNFAGMGADLFAKRTEARDEKGNLLYGDDGNPIINKEYGWGSKIAAKVGQNIGDAAGGAFRAFGWASQANEAANRAGAMAEAGNEQARRGIMESAEQAAKGMNLQNAARGAAMTDSAIANRSAFDMGMQSIGMSGIEGSANMERNLQYGKSNAEAAEQMRYDMMNAEAEGLGNSMAKSFSDLSYGKSQAMQEAWGNSVGGNRAGLTGLYGRRDAEAAKIQPTRDEIEAIEAEAGLIAAKNPDSGIVPENTGYDAQKDHDDMAAGEAAAIEELKDDAQRERPGAGNNPATPAGGGDKTSLYKQIEQYLAQDGTIKQSVSLDEKLKEFGITDPAMIEAIQSGTVKGSGEGKEEWRDRLWKALGGTGNRTGMG